MGKAGIGHVEDLTGRIRRADHEEVWAVAHVDADNALRRSFEASKVAWAFKSEGRVFAIGGVCPSTSAYSIGIPWLLASNDITDAGIFFARHSRQCVEEMHEHYLHLMNWVDARNLESIKWLDWCGFDIEEAKPYGEDRLPFHRFWKTTKG
jgi:nitrite reductase/ring-hydroxylating ferredoxin subunit